MNLFSELKVGDKLEVEPYREGMRQAAHRSIIASQLLDIKDELIYISNPIVRGIPYRLRTGDKIKVIFFREDKGIFSFIAEIKKKIHARLTIYAISPVSEAVKTQRRVYFRLDITRRVTLRPFEEEAAIEGATKDISGGGMRVIARKPILAGRSVECMLYLNDNNVITMPGIVIRCSSDFVTGDYQMGIHFKEESEVVRNRLISFIFEKQREFRKKGLI